MTLSRKAGLATRLSPAHARLSPPPWQYNQTREHQPLRNQLPLPIVHVPLHGRCHPWQVSPSLWMSDPIGAIIISVYIIVSWTRTGMEQLEMIIGKSADPAFLDIVREMAETHDPVMRGNGR